MAVVGAGRLARLGDGSTGRAWVYDGIDAVTPTKVREMRAGFDSVEQMLSTPGATWAHRGGSASYAEHTLHAYTQAVAEGYGVLEISMARTSDGVWFGLHDQTLDRTSALPSGSNVDPKTLTWSELRSLYKVIRSGDIPRPYMSWDELMRTYGQSHVIVADYKWGILGGSALRSEFLDMLDDDLGPRHAVVKFSGSGGGAASLADAATARGYETWGYYYQADYENGSVDLWQSHWSILGMEYTATQATWDAMKAYGKPLVAHIVPDQAGYNTAIAKGADMVQVSGVAQVNAVSRP